MSETPAGRDASNETLNDHSKDPAWVITREEYELDANGKAVRKSFSMERRQEAAKGMSRKDRIDMYIRVTGMAAIFIPLLLFYLQSCNEKQKQQVAAKKEEKKSIYEMQQQITSQVYTILHSKVNSNEQNAACSKLNCELYAQIKMMEDTMVEYQYNRLTSFVDYYKSLAETEQQFSDSLYYNIVEPLNDNYPAPNSMKITGSNSAAFTKMFRKWRKEMDNCAYAVSLADSCCEKLRFIYAPDTSSREHKKLHANVQVYYESADVCKTCMGLCDHIMAAVNESPKQYDEANNEAESLISQVGYLYDNSGVLTRQKEEIAAYIRAVILKDLNHEIRECVHTLFKSTEPG